MALTIAGVLILSTVVASVGSALTTMTTKIPKQRYTGEEQLLLSHSKRFGEIRERRELAAEIAAGLSGKNKTFYNTHAGIKDLFEPAVVIPQEGITVSGLVKRTPYEISKEQIKLSPSQKSETEALVKDIETGVYEREYVERLEKAEALKAEKTIQPSTIIPASSQASNFPR